MDCEIHLRRNLSGNGTNVSGSFHKIFVKNARDALFGADFSRRIARVSVGRANAKKAPLGRRGLLRLRFARDEAAGNGYPHRVAVLLSRVKTGLNRRGFCLGGKHGSGYRPEYPSWHGS